MCESIHPALGSGWLWFEPFGKRCVVYQRSTFTVFRKVNKTVLRMTSKTVLKMSRLDTIYQRPCRPSYAGKSCGLWTVFTYCPRLLRPFISKETICEDEVCYGGDGAGPLPSPVHAREPPFSSPDTCHVAQEVTRIWKRCMR